MICFLILKMLYNLYHLFFKIKFQVINKVFKHVLKIVRFEFLQK